MAPGRRPRAPFQGGFPSCIYCLTAIPAGSLHVHDCINIFKCTCMSSISAIFVSEMHTMYACVYRFPPLHLFICVLIVLVDVLCFICLFAFIGYYSYPPHAEGLADTISHLRVSVPAHRTQLLRRGFLAIPPLCNARSFSAQRASHSVPVHRTVFIGAAR